MTAESTGAIPDAAAAIEVTDLRVTLDSTPILLGIDITVGAGEWVTVIGPNGAGKSTLLRAISGLRRVHRNHLPTGPAGQ